MTNPLPPEAQAAVTRARTWESIYSHEEDDPEHFIHVLRAVPMLAADLAEALQERDVWKRASTSFEEAFEAAVAEQAEDRAKLARIESEMCVCEEAYHWIGCLIHDPHSKLAAILEGGSE